MRKIIIILLSLLTLQTKRIFSDDIQNNQLLDLSRRHRNHHSHKHNKNKQNISIPSTNERQISEKNISLSKIIQNGKQNLNASNISIQQLQNISSKNQLKSQNLNLNISSLVNLEEDDQDIEEQNSKIHNLQENKENLNEFQKCTLNLDRIFDVEGEKIFNYYLQQNQSFIDTSFPEDESSLYWPYQRKNNSKLISQVYRNVFIWKRPSEIINNNLVLDLWGTKGIQPNSVKQGQLNDNWLLASAAALAENPERIKSIISNKNYSKSGIFEFKFWIKAEPVSVVIDDLLPIDPKGDIVNARPSDSNFGWWLVLLEKAYAKININYANLNGGLQAEALRTLTGMPVAIYNSSKYSKLELWINIRENYLKGYVMTSSCRFPKYNLVQNRVYTIINAFEITSVLSDKDEPIKLIKLRDNFQEQKYNGTWSQDDEKWTPRLQIQTGYSQQDDGYFFMTLEDFLESFPFYEVAMYSQFWKKSFTYSDGSKGKEWYFNFNQPEDQELIITLDYLNSRMIPDGCHKPNVFYNIYLRDQNGTVISEKAISNKLSFGQIQFKNYTLKKGDYSVKVINWKDVSERSDFVLTTYASQKEVKILDAQSYLAEQFSIANHTQLIQQRSISQNIISSSYLNKTSKLLTVQIKKPNDKFPQNVKLNLQFYTLDGFPWKSLRSNYDWYKKAEGKFIKETVNNKRLKFYELETVCPQKEQICIYQIPNAVSFLQAKFK